MKYNLQLKGESTALQLIMRMPALSQGCLTNFSLKRRNASPLFNFLFLPFPSIHLLNCHFQSYLDKQAQIEHIVPDFHFCVTSSSEVNQQQSAAVSKAK